MIITMYDIPGKVSVTSCGSLEYPKWFELQALVFDGHLIWFRIKCIKKIVAAQIYCLNKTTTISFMYYD